MAQAFFSGTPRPLMRATASSRIFGMDYSPSTVKEAPEIDIPERLFVLWYWGGRWCQEGKYLNLHNALRAAKTKTIWRIEERTGKIISRNGN